MFKEKKKFDPEFGRRSVVKCQIGDWEARVQVLALL